MMGFWLTFEDGSNGYCEGQSPSDALRIAEHLTGKEVRHEGDKWKPVLHSLPYPANPIVWQFEHPVLGKCPTFCFSPEECKGKGYCTRPIACNE